MNILLLDDDKVRHDLCNKYLVNHTVLHTFNAPDAIDILNANKVDFALLDHDLMDITEDVNGRKLERSGLYFVSEMLTTVSPDRWFPRAIIHSYNADGARYMRDDLRKNGIVADYRPFCGSMLKELVREIG